MLIDIGLGPYTSTANYLRRFLRYGVGVPPLEDALVKKVVLTVNT